jgi:hypothetical protein
MSAHIPTWQERQFEHFSVEVFSLEDDEKFMADEIADLRAALQAQHENKGSQWPRETNLILAEYRAEKAEAEAKRMLETASMYNKMYSEQKQRADKAEAALQAQQGEAKAPAYDADLECQIPPFGWRCTRGAGHEGPCAAIECPDDVAAVAHGMARLAAAAPAPATLSDEEIEQHIDRPGFAWENLTKAEQRSLLSSIRELLAAAGSSQRQDSQYPACKGPNCGATDGRSHSAECQATHEAACAGGYFVKQDVMEEVIGCFRAAEAEGLAQVLSETTDERLKDLVERRLMHALYAALAAKEAGK